MPKDIRSYFTKVSTQPKQNGLERKTNSKKRAIIESDEEDAEESSIIKNKKAKINQNEEKIKTSKLTEITVSSTEELFSKKPIKRVAAPKVTKKVKNTSKDKSSDLFDDEFDESLNQIDTSNFEEKFVGKNDTVNKKSNKHEAESSKKNNEEQDNKKGVKKSDSKSDNSKKENKEKKQSKAKYEIEVTKNDASEKEKKKPTDDIPDFIQEKIEKKKGNAKLYQNYLNRGGARNPGSKEIPKGADSCLSGLTFIISGVLDSLEREEAEEIIKQYGGNVVKSVSKKLDYIIIGDQAGPSKLMKAECLGIKKLSEDDLLELIKTRPGGLVNEKISLSKESRKILESPKKKESNIPVKSNSENSKKRKSESPQKNKEDGKESPKKVKNETFESPKKKDVNNYSKTETSKSQDEKKNVSVDLKKGN